MNVMSVLDSTSPVLGSLFSHPLFPPWSQGYICKVEIVGHTVCKYECMHPMQRTCKNNVPCQAMQCHVNIACLLACLLAHTTTQHVNQTNECV